MNARNVKKVLNILLNWQDIKREFITKILMFLFVDGSYFFFIFIYCESLSVLFIYFICLHFN